MKPCFVKLTAPNDQVFWVNMNTIDSMYVRADETTGLNQPGIDETIYAVTETPEQIINMMRAVK